MIYSDHLAKTLYDGGRCCGDGE